MTEALNVQLDEVVRLKRTDAGAVLGEALREGMKVEARYRGKTRYYPGVIKRVNRDGTFDIDYNDGEKEMFVAAELIRSLEPAASAGGGGMGGGGKIQMP